MGSFPSRTNPIDSYRSTTSPTHEDAFQRRSPSPTASPSLPRRGKKRKCRFLSPIPCSLCCICCAWSHEETSFPLGAILDPHTLSRIYFEDEFPSLSSSEAEAEASSGLVPDRGSFGGKEVAMQKRQEHILRLPIQLCGLALWVLIACFYPAFVSDALLLGFFLYVGLVFIASISITLIRVSLRHRLGWAQVFDMLWLIIGSWSFNLLPFFSANRDGTILIVCGWVLVNTTISLWYAMSNLELILYTSFSMITNSISILLYYGPLDYDGFQLLAFCNGLALISTMASAIIARNFSFRDRQIVADIRRRRDEVDSLARFVLPTTEIAASPAAAEYMKFLMAMGEDKPTSCHGNRIQRVSDELLFECMKSFRIPPFSRIQDIEDMLLDQSSTAGGHTQSDVETSHEDLPPSSPENDVLHRRCLVIDHLRRRPVIGTFRLASVLCAHVRVSELSAEEAYHASHPSVESEIIPLEENSHYNQERIQVDSLAKPSSERARTISNGVQTTSRDHHRVPRIMQLLDIVMTNFDSVVMRHGLAHVSSMSGTYCAFMEIDSSKRVADIREDLVSTLSCAFDLRTCVHRICSMYDCCIQLNIGISCGSVQYGLFGVDNVSFSVFGSPIQRGFALASIGDESGVVLFDSSVERRIQHSAAIRYDRDPVAVFELSETGEKFDAYRTMAVIRDPTLSPRTLEFSPVHEPVESSDSMDNFDLVPLIRSAVDPNDISISEDLDMTRNLHLPEETSTGRNSIFEDSNTIVSAREVGPSNLRLTEDLLHALPSSDGQPCLGENTPRFSLSMTQYPYILGHSSNANPSSVHGRNDSFHGYHAEGVLDQQNSQCCRILVPGHVSTCIDSSLLTSGLSADGSSESECPPSIDDFVRVHGRHSSQRSMVEFLSASVHSREENRLPSGSIESPKASELQRPDVFLIENPSAPHTAADLIWDPMVEDSNQVSQTSSNKEFGSVSSVDSEPEIRGGFPSFSNVFAATPLDEKLTTEVVGSYSQNTSMH